MVLESPSVAAPLRVQSRLSRPVLWPERFRGSCPFGARSWLRGTLPGGVISAIEPTRAGRLPQVTEAFMIRIPARGRGASGRAGQMSSQRNTRTAISVSTAVIASSTPMAGSAETGPSPRAITFCIPVTR
jgi:hypothetical protein